MVRLTRLRQIQIAWLVVLLWLMTPATAQSLWLEGGLGYNETSLADGAGVTFESSFKAGFRVIAPLNSRAGLYLNPYWFKGLGVDAGGWFSFPSGSEDLFGFRSYLGLGLTFVQAQFGLALSGALSYEVARDTEVVPIYTHRPLVLPEFAQAFDISLGLKFDLD